VSKDKRTKKDVQREMDGIQQLYKDGKITKTSFDYLFSKLNEELKTLGNR